MACISSNNGNSLLDSSLIARSQESLDIDIWIYRSVSIVSRSTRWAPQSSLHRINSAMNHASPMNGGRDTTFREQTFCGNSTLQQPARARNQSLVLWQQTPESAGHQVTVWGLRQSVSVSWGIAGRGVTRNDELFSYGIKMFLLAPVNNNPISSMGRIKNQ